MAYLTLAGTPFPCFSFNERVELIVEHERGSGKERARAMASEERDLIDLFRRAEMDYEARLSSQVSLMGPGNKRLLLSSVVRVLTHPNVR